MMSFNLLRLSPLLAYSDVHTDSVVCCVVAAPSNQMEIFNVFVHLFPENSARHIWDL